MMTLAGGRTGARVKDTEVSKDVGVVVEGKPGKEANQEISRKSTTNRCVYWVGRARPWGERLVG